MKLSVSLPDDDVAFLDDFAATHEIPSRSQVLQRAIRLFRAAQLAPDYADAFAEWDDDDWDVASADGLVEST
jgi:Arc/MetJ-type ribon-helix-helix transcriptional regulator